MVDNITYCMDQFYCYGTPGRNMKHTVDLQLPMQSVPITSNYPGKRLLWDRYNEVRLYVCSLLFCVSMVSCLGWLTWMGMVFNVVFNNISVITVLLAEKTAVPGENHRPVTNHWQTLSHNVESSTPRHERDSKSQL